MQGAKAARKASLQPEPHTLWRRPDLLFEWSIQFHLFWHGRLSLIVGQSVPFRAQNAHHNLIVKLTVPIDRFAQAAFALEACLFIGPNGTLIEVKHTEFNPVQA